MLSCKDYSFKLFPITQVNGEPMEGMTKSEAALRILRTQKKLRLEVKHAAEKYNAFLSDRLGPGDDFYVRAAFSYTPAAMPGNEGRPLDPNIPITALQISMGDIFHVTDSLLAGSFTSWLVSVYK